MPITIGIWSEMVFSIRSVQSGYKEEFGLESATRVEAASNTSTVTLRDVGGEEKGSLKSETVNMVVSPNRIGPEKDCSIYKRQTRPLVREGAPQKQNRNCQTVINIW
jgi:hypothetical protein